MGQVDIDLGLDAPRARRHHHHAGGEEDRLFDIVGNEQHRLFFPLPDAEQHLLHERTCLIVERAEGFIEQHDFWIIGEHPGNGSALLHATRELPRIMAFEARETDTNAPFLGGLTSLYFRHAPLAQTEGNVVDDGQPWEQGVGLEHHAAIGAWSGDGLAVEQNATIAGAVEAGNDPQQGRFATTRRTQNGDEIVVGDAQRDWLEGACRPAPTAHGREGPRDAIDDELAHGSLRLSNLFASLSDHAAADCGSVRDFDWLRPVLSFVFAAYLPAQNGGRGGVPITANSRGRAPG